MGRKTYAALARSSLANARRHLSDANRLRKSGSRGHASGFAVLSIEESSKALIYHQAGAGILRIVERKPNRITTFSEKDLLDHRFKHAILGGLLVHWLQYAPFYESISRLRKATFTQAQVKDLVLRAIHAHQLLQIDLGSGGGLAREIRKVLGTIDNLNAIKNRGFYVDHAHGRIVSPHDTTKKQLDEVMTLADGALEMVTDFLQRGVSERERRFQKAASQSLLSAFRRAQRRAILGQSTGPSVRERGSPDAGLPVASASKSPRRA